MSPRKPNPETELSPEDLPYDIPDETDGTGNELAVQTSVAEDALAAIDWDEVDIGAIPDLKFRLQEAAQPSMVSSQDILGHDVVWVAWQPQNALMKQTGEVTAGYFAVGRDLTDGLNIALFIGGIALCRTLKRVAAPMRAKIELRGRTLVFR